MNHHKCPIFHGNFWITLPLVLVLSILLATGGVRAAENRDFPALETPPSPFGKNSPIDGTRDIPSSFTLAWSASDGATGYEYCLDKVDNLTCDTTWISVGGNTSAFLEYITLGQKFYWQVRAGNGDGFTYADGGAWWTFYILPSFNDVPSTYWAWDWIERLLRSGITGGCGAGNYCPESPVTRAQMAIFLERGMNGGSTYVPPTGTGTVFVDVPLTYWAVDWIENLFGDGITSGCGTGLYCPESPVTRAQMAIFLLRARHGAAYIPPAATGLFLDVPTSFWAAAWIEHLYAESITGGCGTSPLRYCPANPVTRAQMAVFLVRTFNLP